MAIEHYSKAMTLSVKEQSITPKLMAAVYCNRSLAYMKSHLHTEVIPSWTCSIAPKR